MLVKDFFTFHPFGLESQCWYQLTLFIEMFQQIFLMCSCSCCTETAIFVSRSLIPKIPYIYEPSVDSSVQSLEKKSKFLAIIALCKYFSVCSILRFSVKKTSFWELGQKPIHAIVFALATLYRSCTIVKLSCWIFLHFSALLDCNLLSEVF